MTGKERKLALKYYKEYVYEEGMTKNPSDEFLKSLMGTRQYAHFHLTEAHKRFWLDYTKATNEALNEAFWRANK